MCAVCVCVCVCVYVCVQMYACKMCIYTFCIYKHSPSHTRAQTKGIEKMFYMTYTRVLPTVLNKQGGTYHKTTANCTRWTLTKDIEIKLDVKVRCELHKNAARNFD